MSAMTPARSEVLVPAEPGDRNELLNLADAAGWRLLARFPTGLGEYLELRWITPDGVGVGYVEDHHNGVHLVTVSGADDRAVAATTTTLTDALSVHTVDDLLTALTDDDATDPASTVRLWRSYDSAMAYLPIGAPLDARLVAAAERLLRHPDRRIRLRVLMACAQLGERWPRMLKLVADRDGEETELAHVVDAIKRAVA
ncbi:MAG: hypothetical protein ACRD0P_04280 [Stackebrandtia sp.]